MDFVVREGYEEYKQPSNLIIFRELDLTSNLVRDVWKICKNENLEIERIPPVVFILPTPPKRTKVAAEDSSFKS